MRSVILTICVVACFITIYGEERIARNEQFMKDLEICKADTKATEEDAKIVIGRQKLVTKESACLLACIKKKSGAMTADNKMDVVKSKELLEPMKAQSEEMYNSMLKIFLTCKKQETNETNECDAAKKFSDCMIELRSKL